MAKSIWDKDVAGIVENSLLDNILFYRYEYNVSWKHMEDTLIKEVKELIKQVKKDMEEENE